ncbi:copper resistance protein B [Sphingomonas mucosissima]|uniref:Copper resistance protein B n=1 Tax=Sphingomonas mucosissima TaxID=370959 RepID=A0A245ZLZ1_9SPHN|nr:copper resistance protein B [Sphingomonas mucosissima]OWK30753.1 copper resistance protein B precursor [Sphingomonas mucosissima]
MIALLLAAAAMSGIGTAPQSMDHAHHANAPSTSANAPAAVPKPDPAATKPEASPAAQKDGHHHAPVATSSAADPSCPPEHAAMGHCRPKAADTVSGKAETRPEGTALQAGNAPAPAAAVANYADRVWGTDAMAAARKTMRQEHGGMTVSQVMLDLAEVQVRNGADGYRWEGAFWYGGDIDRLTIKTEGEGSFNGSADAEVQALYSRAIGPYFNMQAGLRQDFTPGSDRTYATVGFEGLAPYWFDIEGAVFLSDQGDVFGRLEGYYDQRITQRLVLQPRAELNLSAQDVASRRIGSGVTDAELGLRLRYEIVRELAPYVGVSWERRFGSTARYARADGDRTGGFSLVAGVRAWF